MRIDLAVTASFVVDTATSGCMGSVVCDHD